MPARTNRMRLPAVALFGTVLLLGAMPATAQLVHRDRGGNLLINPLLCQTDYQVRRAIAARGFRDIFLNAPIESHIQVRATKGNTVYLIDYNRCFNYIVSATPLRRAR